MKVLFVCTGNLCRSAAAEKLLALKEVPGVVVRSRGVAAQPYGGMPRQVKDFLIKAGVKEPGHKAQFIAEADVDWADLILVMENGHFDALAERFPQGGRKTHLFVEYCTGKEGAQLKDPMGLTDKVFEEILGMVQACVKELARKLGA